MGSGLGTYIKTGYDAYFHPELSPQFNEEPTFDPNLGFPSARKERQMVATDQEMRSARLPLKDRDYCAHLLLKFRSCRAENFPWVVNCHHEKHAYLDCKYDDWVLRMKEFEREKRLRARAQEAVRRQEAA